MQSQRRAGLLAAGLLLLFLLALLLAGEPWLVGLGRIIHLDELAALLLSCAVLAVLASWRHNGSLALLVLAGATGGLAVLTRTSALVLVPLFGLLGLWELLHRPK